MDIYTYMDIYKILYNTCGLHTTAICQLSLSPHSQQRLLPAKSRGWSTTDLFLTNSRDLVLWKCSYGPWDHFMFSANNLILLATRYRKHHHSDLFTFQIYVQMQSSIMHNVAKGFYILEKCFYILEKCVYFLEKCYSFLEIAIVEIWWAR